MHIPSLQKSVVFRHPVRQAVKAAGLQSGSYEPDCRPVFFMAKKVLKIFVVTIDITTSRCYDMAVG